MESKQSNPMEELYASVKDYLNMRIDEAKLSTTELVATLFSKIIIFVLVIVLGAIVASFFAAAFCQWIGTLIGSIIYAELITGGLFLLAIICVYIFRRRLFTDSMVRMLIKLLFKEKGNGK